MIPLGGTSQRPSRLTQLGGKVRQHRGGEQDSLRQRSDAPCAQPLHQLNRQQRVAAEFEEVVVAADPLEPEHFGPDGGQRASRSRRLAAS